MLVNIFVLLIGLIIGSFLNVCISRLPKEESILFPGSHCPKCQAKINWFDNLPLISYLLLLGKCRSCREPISIRYPLVELITGLAFLLLSLMPNAINSLSFYFNALFISGMIVAFFSDLETEIIPDEVIFCLIPISLLYHFFTGKIIDALLGAILGFLLLFSIQKFGKLVFKKDALGDGDVKLAALFGAALLWPGVLLAIFMGYLLGSIEALFLLSLKIKRMDDYIAFGPALITGAIITLFWGQNIVEWYFRMIFNI